jgi:hypothetical protein
MMLQPISPRLSGEFSTQLDINCGAAVFGVSIANSVTAIDEDPIHFVIRNPPEYRP